MLATWLGPVAGPAAAQPYAPYAGGRWKAGEIKRILNLSKKAPAGWPPALLRAFRLIHEGRLLSYQGASRQKIEDTLMSGEPLESPTAVAQALAARDQPWWNDPKRVDVADLQARQALAFHYMADVLDTPLGAINDRMSRRRPSWLRRLLEFDAAVSSGDGPAALFHFKRVGLALFEVLAQSPIPPRLVSKFAPLPSPAPPVSSTQSPLSQATASPKGEPVGGLGGRMSEAKGPPSPEIPPGSPAQRASPKGEPVAVTPEAVGPKAKPSPPPASSRAGPPKGRRLLGLLMLIGAIGGTVRFLRRRGSSTRPTALADALNLMASGKAQEALPLLQKAIASGPPDLNDIRCHLTRCLLRLGQLDLAMQAHAEIDLTRTGQRAIYLLARELEERSQKAQALAAYARLYLVASDYEDVRTRYEKLKQGQGPSSAITSIGDLAARLPARYTGVERLGEGGMGIVLKARDSQLKCAVAIKIISPLAAQDTQFIKRFHREIKAMALLAHPNIVRIYESFTAPIHFYTMEYICAPTLHEVLSKGRLTTGRALEIGSQVAAGLDCAHRQSVVHRDIKPGNILVGEDDQVKILDFGLAHVGGATALTRTGQAPGTLLYMAPEQLKGVRVGPSADIYALGLVLIEMVTGRCPFEKQDPVVKLTVAPPRLPDDAILGSALADLAAACTALEPEGRPLAGDLAARLSRLSAQQADHGASDGV